MCEAVGECWKGRRIGDVFDRANDAGLGPVQAVSYTYTGRRRRSGCARARIDKYDTKAFCEFEGALKDLVSVIRDVYGLPTLTMDIAEKRFRLYEHKVHSESEEAHCRRCIFAAYAGR